MDGALLDDKAKRMVAEYAIVCIIYLAISAILFLPEIGNLQTTVLGNSGDVYQNLWDIWWAKYALLIGHVGIYSTTSMLFWPVGVNLVFQTLSPISGIISIPLQAVSLQFAYNCLFFLGFVVSGFGAFLLAQYILRDRRAAFLAGLFFSFSAFHIANSFDHLDFFFIGWIPIFIYFFLRILDDDKKYAWAVCAGFSFVMLIFMDEFEEGIMLLMLLALMVAVKLALKEERGKILNRKFVFAMLTVCATVLLLGSFGIVPLVRTALAPGGLSAAYSQNQLIDNIAWSADVFSFLIPNYYFYNGGIQGTAPNLFYGSSDRTVYIGYMLMFLAAFGLYKSRSRQWLWAGVFIAFVLLSIGPYVKISNHYTPIPGPYQLYHALPYINLIREPARFYLIASLAIAILAAAGAKEIIGRLEHRKQYIYPFIASVAILFMLETFGMPVWSSPQIATTPYVPQILHSLGSMQGGNYTFLVLPSPDTPNYLYSGIADYYGTVLQMPLVGGYISRDTSLDVLTLGSLPIVGTETYLATYNNSYFTPPYTSPIAENYTLQSFKTLSDYGTRYIIVENNAYSAKNLNIINGFNTHLFGQPVYSDSNITIFSTASALQANFYQSSFISYYNPAHWAYIYSNATSEGWEPENGYGLITTFAPYPGGIAAPVYTFVNASLSFYAVSYINQTVVVESCACGINNTVAKAPVQLYSGGHVYSGIKIRMVSGPHGNVVEFFDQYLQQPQNQTLVLFNDVNFTYAR